MDPGPGAPTRRGPAGRWLRTGIPRVVVAALLGHARPTTTLAYYVTATTGDLLQGLNADLLVALTAAL